jgi:hypothetical protein
MVEYFYSSKNYEDALLTDASRSAELVLYYISEHNHPGVTRYLISNDKRHTQEKFYLYHVMGYVQIYADDVAIDGQLELVKYFYSKGFKVTQNGIDLTAEYGCVEVLKYLYKQGGSTVQRRVTSKNYKPKVKVTKDGINWAAKNGHLALVKYLYSCGVKANKNGVDRAAENGHLALVKYLYGYGIKATSWGINLSYGRGRITSKTT